MINSEKDLEDYICENQEDFIKELHYGFHIHSSKEIKFIGRQVKIGENNIVDLMYYYDEPLLDIVEEKGKTVEKIVNINRNFIIVELKYREIDPKDLAQLRRYMTTLRDKILSDRKYTDNFDEVYVLGAFVSFGENELMKDVLMNLEENIISLKIRPQFYFEKEDYSHIDEYIKNLKLDGRIEEIYK